jgi:hypothetical protein
MVGDSTVSTRPNSQRPTGLPEISMGPASPLVGTGVMLVDWCTITRSPAEMPAVVLTGMSVAPAVRAAVTWA